jgi:hypothetical protein
LIGLRLRHKLSFDSFILAQRIGWQLATGGLLSMLRNFMKDTIALVKPSGERIEGIRAAVTPDKIFIDDGELPLEEGDTLERLLPNNLVERYRVLDRGYFAKFRSQAAHYQAKVEKESTLPPKAAGDATVYNVSGSNARINVHSTDSSINIVNIAPAGLFKQLASAIEAGVQSEADRRELLARVDKLEEGSRSGRFLSAYQQFIAVAADHMTIVAPFLPALAQLANR